MVVKVKEKFEKTRHVKISDKFTKYILRGRRNVRYFEKILSNRKKSYNFIFELEHLIEPEHLPEHLNGILFGGNTKT